jgi:hypothetical protein
MSYPTFRRRRRRRTLVAVVVAAVILALAIAVALARSDRQASREYLDAAFDVVTGEEALATQFEDLVDRLREMARPVVTQTLELLEADSGVLVEELSRLEAPGQGDLFRADSFLAIAVASWRDGLTGFRLAILTLSNDPLDEAGRAQLEASLNDLRVGDAAYEEFQSTVRVIPEADALAVPFPSVEFVPAASADLFTLDSIIRKMLQAPGLGVVTNVGIADIRLDPSPTGERNGIPVVPVSDTLTAEATISNNGTVPVDTIIINLTLVSNTGETHEERRAIERLEPGELTTVTFADLPVVDGRLYEIAFALGGRDDDSSDDRESFQFLRNADE